MTEQNIDILKWDTPWFCYFKPKKGLQHQQDFKPEYPENRIHRGAAPVRTRRFRCIWFIGCHLNFRFWINSVNSHWLGRRRFSTRVLGTKRGRLSVCWTSQEIPGYVPDNSPRKRATVTTKSGDPACLAWNKEDTCPQSSGWVWPPHHDVTISGVTRLTN